MFQPSSQRQITGVTIPVQILPNYPSQFVRLVIASHRQLTVLNTMLAKENVLESCAGCVLKVIQKLCGQRTVHPSRIVTIIGFGFCS